MLADSNAIIVSSQESGTSLDKYLLPTSDGFRRSASRTTGPEEQAWPGPVFLLTWDTRETLVFGRMQIGEMGNILLMQN